MQRNVLLLATALTLGANGPAFAQSNALLPKYGGASNDVALNLEKQQALADSERLHPGNPKKSAKALELQGWQLLRQAKNDAAMQSFNKAWLLETSNGNALWGMAQIEANRGHAKESLRLFTEASRLVGYDIHFAVDHARALSLAGVQLGDAKLTDEALRRFAQIHNRAPQHTLNLQNWAIALFYTGQYGPAWEKIKAAQATPSGAGVDKQFVADLQRKMPRP